MREFVFTDYQTYDARRQFVLKDIQERMKLNTRFPSDAVMQQPGVMAETFLYVMGETANVDACSALLSSELPRLNGLGLIRRGNSRLSIRIE